MWFIIDLVFNYFKIFRICFDDVLDFFEMFDNNVIQKKVYEFVYFK